MVAAARNENRLGSVSGLWRHSVKSMVAKSSTPRRPSGAGDAIWLE
jgi:hypothetical protein